MCIYAISLHYKMVWVQTRCHHRSFLGGNTFIIWGVSTLIAALVVGITLYATDSVMPHWLWMLIPVIGTVWSKCSKSGSKQYKTQIDTMIRQLWAIIMITTLAIPLIVLLFNWAGGRSFVLLWCIVPFVEMLVCSVGLAVTGAVIDFKAVKIGGLFGVLLSFGLFLQFEYNTIIIFALWAVVTMIVPGIGLNIEIAKKTAENV